MSIQQAEVTSDQRALNVVPALIADLGEEAAWRYVEFFTAIFGWCDDRGLTPAAIRPHVAGSLSSDPSNALPLP